MNEENIKKIIELISQGITEVSSKLGVAVPHLWEVLVKQQYVEALQVLVGWVFVIAGWVFVRLTVKWVAKSNSDNDEGTFTVIFIAIITLVIITLWNIGSTKDAIGKVLNPEYYAIKTIMEEVKR